MRMITNCILGTLLAIGILAAGILATGSTSVDAREGREDRNMAVAQIEQACQPGGQCACSGTKDSISRCLSDDMATCEKAGGVLRLNADTSTSRSADGRSGRTNITMSCTESKAAANMGSAKPLAVAKPGATAHCTKGQPCICTGSNTASGAIGCMINEMNLCSTSGGTPTVLGMTPPSSEGGDVSIYMSCVDI